MRNAITIGALALLAGCTWLNAPSDPTEFQPTDGGMRDGDASDDGGEDGGDAGVDGSVPEDCESPGDEDGDGFSDCSDFDCIGSPACCDESMGERLLHEQWQPPSPRIQDTWFSLPQSTSVYPSTSAGRLTSFNGGADPSGIRTRNCIPMVLGTRITTSFQVDSSCPEPCNQFASLVLTAATDTAPGQRILDELAISVDPVNVLTITRNREPLIAPRMVEGANTGVVLQITPGVTEAGDRVMFATLQVNGTVVPEIDDYLLMPQRHLVSGVPGCENDAGLYLAVEGVGSGVDVLPIEAQTMQCTNPTELRRTTIAPIDATTLQMTWATGGVASPALAHGVSSGFATWNLVVDGTNVERSQERFSNVGFALGYQTTTAWSVWTAPTSPMVPYLGPNPPHCADGTCTPGRAVRDPALLLITNMDGDVVNARAVVAQSIDRIDMVGRSRYALHRVDSFLGPARSILPTPMLSPDSYMVGDGGPHCTSLRDPTLVHATSTSTDGYWMLFTCERAGAPEIHAVGVLDSGAVVEGTETIVLTRDDVPAFGPLGVRAPEAIAVDRSGERLVRVWFRALGAESSIGLAQAVLAGPPTLRQPFPDLVLYPSNPVIRRDDLECSDCDVTGLAVAQEVDMSGIPTPRIRILVARVLQPDGDAVYQLVPFDQYWSTR